MTTSFHQTINSMETVLSSIETDRQVYRWFTFLIIQPQTKVKFLNSPEIKQEYLTLKKILINQTILYGALIVLLFIILPIKKLPYLLVFLTFIWPYWRLQSDKRKCIIRISRHMLSCDFEETELKRKTLYQITEHYSREYKIPSLVDIIYTSDRLARAILLGLVGIICYIYPLQLRLSQMLIAVLILYFLIKALVDTTFTYRNLK